MTHASLFSGIGGAELAATWAGWQNLFHCEINPFCRPSARHRLFHARFGMRRAFLFHTAASWTTAPTMTGLETQTPSSR